MIEKFDGFANATFRFLRGLSDNNNKEWFELHKPDYQDNVLKPLQSLVNGLAPLMLSIDPDFEITPSVNKTISRIYRDTRFSRNKSPYKTSHWITFKRPRVEWKDYPAYFFEISPNSYRYGMGFYSASRETMDRFRNNIDKKQAAFSSATSFFSKQSIFVIEGEEYKRPLRAGIAPELHDWYNRKSLYLVSHQQLDSDSIDKRLLPDLMHGFQILAPFYQYLCKVAAH